ncbi:hypothetical protein, partial [Candidatus Protofrankia californiensis]|uniref:hypothetical protein n=1 Tax=Candidatus Protofrankia californiensis TaxID=1839754 RepID=UPI0019D1214E
MTDRPGCSNRLDRSAARGADLPPVHGTSAVGRVWPIPVGGMRLALSGRVPLRVGLRPTPPPLTFYLSP